MEDGWYADNGIIEYCKKYPNDSQCSLGVLNDYHPGNYITKAMYDAGTFGSCQIGVNNMSIHGTGLVKLFNNCFNDHSASFNVKVQEIGYKRYDYRIIQLFGQSPLVLIGIACVFILLTQMTTQVVIPTYTNFTERDQFYKELGQHMASRRLRPLGTSLYLS